MRLLSILFVLPASATLAESFDRPIPQAQSATAELYYGLACVALVMALIGVQRLVSKR